MNDTAWELKEKRYWGVWAEAAEQVSAYWQAQEHSTMTHYLQGLREQGKIGLAKGRATSLCARNRMVASMFGVGEPMGHKKFPK